MGSGDYGSILSRKECDEIAKKALDSNDVGELRYEIQHLTNVTGYLGDYFKIVITVPRDGLEEKVHLFAKTLPKSAECFKTLALNSFKKEEFVYNKYFGLLKSRGFGDLLDFTPKFYHSRPDEIVIFEDLTQKGYTTLDLTKLPDYDLINSFILKLGKLHACSLLLEESESSRIGKLFRIGEEFPEFMSDFMFSGENDTSELNKLSVDTIADYIIRKFPDIPKNISMDEFADKIMKLKEQMFSSSMNTSKKYRNVLSHGDAWLTNFIIKKDESGQILDSLLIDFQLIRYNPPVIDLIFAIYLCTDKEFRTKYLNTLLENYHEQLSNILKRYGYDINRIIDYQTLLESLTELKPTGIACAICYGHVVMIPKEKQAVLKTDEALADRFYNHNRGEFMELVNVWEDREYSRRIKELVEDLYDAIKDTG